MVGCVSATGSDDGNVSSSAFSSSASCSRLSLDLVFFFSGRSECGFLGFMTSPSLAPCSIDRDRHPRRGQVVQTFQPPGGSAYETARNFPARLASMDDLDHGSRAGVYDQDLIGHERILVIRCLRHQFHDCLGQGFELDRGGYLSPYGRAETRGRRILLRSSGADALIDRLALGIAQLQARDALGRIGGAAPGALLATSPALS